MPSRGQGGVYKGRLAKPIILRPPPTFWGAATEKRVAAYQKKRTHHERANAALVKRQLWKKLALLFDHYGIVQKKDMTALALTLALEHVPGFKVQFPKAKSRAGRKPKWDPGRLEELYETVQAVKRQRGLKDRQILKLLVNNRQYAPVWGVPVGHKGSKDQWIETLEARLQDAKSLQKLLDQAERDLDEAAASIKFRK
jgi:hypothetical protein